jgi:hypothetical protein
MGTITRTFANNITTSGVFKPTAFNNASFDNVTAVPEGVIEGGNMVLLSTQTASGSASISFTSGIDSTYKEYMFVFNNIHPATNAAKFRLIGSTDGGSSYGVATTTSMFEALVDESGSSPTLRYEDGDDVAQSSSAFPISTGIGSDNDECLSGFLHLFEPSSSTFVKHFLTSTNLVNGSGTSYTVSTRVGGYFNTTSAIDAVQFTMSSGNIDAGTIQMFGIL